jgi:hypothetical protein
MTVAQQVRVQDCGVAKSNPSLQPSPQGERELIGGFSELEFDWVFQVDATRENNAVSPLSLRERARVRSFRSADAFQRY